MVGLGLGLDLCRGHSFSPLQLPNLAGWWDASNNSSLVAYGTGLPPVNNDSVTAWNDLSGNGRNASQATASKMPLYRTGIQNGLPAVLLDGADDFLSLALTVGAASLTVFSVLQSTPGAAARSPLGASGSGAGFRVNTDRTVRLVKQSVATVFTTSGTIASGAMGVLTLAYQDNTTNGVANWNGAALGFATGPTATTNFSGSTNGIGATGAGTVEWFKDYLCELIVFTRYLTSPEIARVEAYLKAKWGTP
jgi:hypothetical protein